MNTKPKYVRMVDGVPCMTIAEHEAIVASLSAPASGTAGEAEESARCKSSRERWIAMSCEFEHRLETLRSSLWSIVEHWKRRADESEYGPAYASCADEIKAELIDDAATSPSASSSAAAGAVDERMIERAARALAALRGEDFDYISKFMRAKFLDGAESILTAALTTQPEDRDEVKPEYQCN